MKPQARVWRKPQPAREFPYAATYPNVTPPAAWAAMLTPADDRYPYSDCPCESRRHGGLCVCRHPASNYPPT